MIAVTGGTGFIGSYVLSSLALPYRNVSRNPARIRPGDVLGDLRNFEDRRNLVIGCESLIHFAAVSNPRTSTKDPVADLEMNLLPTVALFEGFAQHNPKGHIIFSSTGGGIYDSSLPHVARKESDPLSPDSNYGVHKLAAENYLRLSCKRFGIGATILRIGNPYGVLLPVARAQGLVGVALSCLQNDQELPIFGSLQTVRDHIHLDDVSAAVAGALRVPARSGELRIFNVGSGVGLSTQEVLDAIERVAKKTLRKVMRETTAAEPQWNVLDCRKIADELGWRAATSFEEGLARTLRGRG